jgi:hypothetical protein
MNGDDAMGGREELTGEGREGGLTRNSTLVSLSFVSLFVLLLLLLLFMMISRAHHVKPT